LFLIAMPTSLQQTSASVPASSEERREIDRLRRIYEQRSHSKLSQRYSRTNPGHLYALHEREAAMADLLRSAGLRSLAGLRILDVGCGAGATLRQYLEYEADPDRMWGIDLLPGFVEKARSGLSNLQVVCGSASKLPFPDSSFDFVSQFMLLTSVLDTAVRNQIAREIDRVLVPGGKLLWYDFAFNNPSNPDVRGIRLAEVRQLFPGYSMTSRRITLAPPLGRVIGRFGPTPYYLTSGMRFLCTHYLCLLEKLAPFVG
jgi:ubiquinone/menaquinone biosynthesis C-methylase UbiE